MSEKQTNKQTKQSKTKQNNPPKYTNFFLGEIVIPRYCIEGGW